MRVWAIASLLLLAGCVQDAPQEPAAEAREDAQQPVENATFHAPTHPVGRAWTFRGIQQYNPDEEIVVVVAEASADGYLFAGFAEDDVHYDALWGNPLMGRRDASLMRENFWPYLHFPLTDGASWPLTDDITLTARRATVKTPLGDENGFTIVGGDDRISMRWDYSPALGQIVLQSTVLSDGTVLDDHRLVKVEEGRAWTWYERGDIVAAWSPHQPAAFDVPPGYDAVLVSAGGREGSRTSVQSPSGASWSAEFPGEERWLHGTLPASPGKWSAIVASEPFLAEVEPPPAVDYPVGWAHTQMAPVKWIRSS